MFEPPGDYDRIAVEWSALTSRGFFHWLAGEVLRSIDGHTSFDQHRDALKQWAMVRDEFLQSPKTTRANLSGPAERQRCLGILGAALSCAEIASRHPKQREIAIRALRELHAEKAGEYPQPAILDDEAWAWSCVRWLMEPTARETQVWIALHDGTAQRNRGYVARLILETFSDGSGQTSRHPQDSFAQPPEEEFNLSIKRAWEFAKRLLPSPTTAPSDGRWRVVRRDALPVGRLTGRSAGAAAARGWWMALQNKVPDDGVIVLAQLGTSDHLQLEQVDHVSEKVEAIVLENANISPDSEHIDTIVVAGLKDKIEAERTLGPGSPIRVLIPGHAV